MWYHQNKIYQNSANDTSSLKNNYIDAILEDHYGNLMIGTSRGLQIYDWRLDGFIDYEFPNIPEKLKI